MIRASKTVNTLDKRSKHSIWKFFSNLFNNSEQPIRPIPPHLQYQASTNQIAPGVRALPRSTHDFLDSEVGKLVLFVSYIFYISFKYYLLSRILI